MPFFGRCVRHPFIYDKRIVPAFVEFVLHSIDDIGINVVETGFPGFILTKKWVLWVVGNLAKGQFCVDNLFNDVIIQDKILERTNRGRSRHCCFRKSGTERRRVATRKLCREKSIATQRYVRAIIIYSRALHVPKSLGVYLPDQQQTRQRCFG